MLFMSALPAYQPSKQKNHEKENEFGEPDQFKLD